MSSKRRAARPPKRWYLADLVERIAVSGDRRTLVHINTRLVRAATHEAAYDAAVALGREGERAYDNPHGRRVRVTFLGLRCLSEIGVDLEHGTEVAYDQQVGLSEAEIAGLVRPRADLVSRPTGEADPDVPNYMPAMVAEMMRRDGLDLPVWVALPPPPSTEE